MCNAHSVMLKVGMHVLADCASNEHRSMQKGTCHDTVQAAMNVLEPGGCTHLVRLELVLLLASCLLLFDLLLNPRQLGLQLLAGFQVLGAL